jgi:hypothetical protein
MIASIVDEDVGVAKGRLDALKGSVHRLGIANVDSDGQGLDGWEGLLDVCLNGLKLLCGGSQKDQALDACFGKGRDVALWRRQYRECSGSGRRTLAPTPRLAPVITTTLPASESSGLVGSIEGYWSEYTLRVN